MRNTISKLLICIVLCILSAPTLALTKQSEPVLVFAAASLKNALDELIEQYPDRDSIKISYASSGVLARQIEAAAPADIFLSANKAWVDYLIKHKVAHDKNIGIFATNTLVLAAKSDQKNLLETNEFLTVGRFSMADPRHVPAGIYAKQALQNLGYWDSAKTQAVFGENVRISLAMLTRGDVNAAIIYRSDLTLTPDIKAAFHFDPTTHDAIEYYYALIKDQNKNADTFIKFLSSEQAQSILKRNGFDQSGSKTNQ